MYEIFEHTADLGIRARGADLPELFADAARGLFSILVANLDAVRPAKERRFQLFGDNLEELLHDWLTELLYTFSVRRMAFVRFNVDVSPRGLSARARGEPINPDRHKIDAEVKAVTWHALKVEQDADGWIAEVIVDV